MITFCPEHYVTATCLCGRCSAVIFIAAIPSSEYVPGKLPDGLPLETIELAKIGLCMDCYQESFTLGS